MTHPAEQRALLDDLLDMVAAGTLDPVRPAEYPLEDVAVALDDLLGRRAVGEDRAGALSGRERGEGRRSTAARGATS